MKKANKPTATFQHLIELQMVTSGSFHFHFGEIYKPVSVVSYLFSSSVLLSRRLVCCLLLPSFMNWRTALKLTFFSVILCTPCLLPLAFSFWNVRKINNLVRQNMYKHCCLEMITIVIKLMGFDYSNTSLIQQLQFCVERIGNVSREK